MARVCHRPEIVELPKDEKTLTASVLNVTKTPISPPPREALVFLIHQMEGIVPLFPPSRIYKGPEHKVWRKPKGVQMLGAPSGPHTSGHPHLPALPTDKVQVSL